jgi:hypothetical protein
MGVSKINNNALMQILLCFMVVVYNNRCTIKRTFLPADCGFIRNRRNLLWPQGGNHGIIFLNKKVAQTFLSFYRLKDIANNEKGVCL